MKMSEVTVERQYGRVEQIHTVVSFSFEVKVVFIRLSPMLRQTPKINRRITGPLLVGLCTFGGLPDGKGAHRAMKGLKRNPNHLSNPCRAISICIAGCRGLVCMLSKETVKGLCKLLDLGKEKVVAIKLGIDEMAQKFDKHLFGSKA